MLNDVTVTSPDTIRDAFIRLCMPLRHGELANPDQYPTTSFMLDDQIKTPNMIRPINGQTGFFRYPVMMHSAMETADTLPGNGPIRILSFPSSIACEAHSLAAIGVANELGASRGGFTIDTFDISAKFTALARPRLYPREFGDIITAKQRGMLFDPDYRDHDSMLRIRDDVAAHVRILDPQRAENFAPDAPYDVIMANNIFMYMDNDQIARTVDMINRSCRHLFIFMDGTHNGNSLHYHSKPAADFVDILDHPSLRASVLADCKLNDPDTSVWARNKL